MTAEEFLNKKINPGDKVVLNGKIVCFFGGFKTFDGVQPDLECSLYPVFYAVGKKGQLVKRSPFEYGGTYLGLHDVKSIRKARYPRFRVTLVQRGNPDVKRTETVRANSSSDAEFYMHQAYAIEGWAVAGSKRLKD